MLFLNISTAQQKIRNHVVARRLNQGLTQQGLADRSGVSAHTLRRFEQTGLISLESFLKLLAVLDGLEDVVNAVELPEEQFSSMEEVLISMTPKKIRKRGWRT